MPEKSTAVPRGAVSGGGKGTGYEILLVRGSDEATRCVEILCSTGREAAFPKVDRGHPDYSDEEEPGGSAARNCWTERGVNGYGEIREMFPSMDRSG